MNLRKDIHLAAMIFVKDLEFKRMSLTALLTQFITQQFPEN